MKKPLIAVAVAAALPAFAYAQTNVTLTGNLKTGIAYTDYDKGATNNGDHTAMADGSSRFIIRGTEDLGGGLKAIFQWDNRVRVDDGSSSSLGGGNTFVGLSGNFGTIRLGRLDLYYNQGSDRFDAYATAHQASNRAIMSYVGDNTNPIARTSRTENVVRYDLPKFRGLSGGLAWSPGGASPEGATMDDGNKGDTWTVDLAWSGGPITVGGAYWDQDYEGYKLAAPGAINGQQAWRLYGNYNFGIFTVGLMYDQSELKVAGGGDRERAAWSIPVTAKLGPGTFLFTYSQADDFEVAGRDVNDSGAKMYAIGYDYPLSKRTSLGVSYAMVDNDRNAAYGFYSRSNLNATVAGQEAKQFYVGIRHAF